MTQQEIKKDLSKRGYNCGQMIAVLLENVCGLDREIAVGSMASFCENCGPGCSALKGGDKCIRLYCRRSAFECDDVMKKAQDMSDAMRKEFVAKHGSDQCAELRDPKLGMAACSGYIDDVVDIITKIVHKEKAMH